MIIKDIKNLHIGKVIEKPIMKDYTTYKVGGKVICIVFPDDEKALIKFEMYGKEKEITTKNIIIATGRKIKRSGISNEEKYIPDLIIKKLEECGCKFNIKKSVEAVMQPRIFSFHPMCNYIGKNIIKKLNINNHIFHYIIQHIYDHIIVRPP